MPRLHRLLALAAACHGAMALAQGPDDWSLSGFNSLRGEHYGVSGAATGAPYAFTGGQFYDEFGLNLSRRFSPYESLQGQFSGVMNASDYRSSERGAMLERGRLVWEKGDGALPFRVEAGDFQAGLSPRVIQRALKGVLLELQPGPPGRYSLQGFAGQAAPIYRNLTESRELASGFSWLFEDEWLGGFSVNAVRATKAATANLPDYGQDTWGLGWNRVYRLAGHELEAEAEWAHFSGQHGATGVLRTDRGQAVFAQITGRAQPLDYRLRHSRNDGGFRPLEAAITPDQRATEAYLGWLADNGLQSRWRVLDSRDGHSGANPMDSRILGYSLGGSLGGGLNTWLDLSRQTRADRNRSTDTRSDALALSLSLPLSGALQLRSTLQGNELRDAVSGSHGISRQLNLALDYAFLAGSGWSGRLSPGLLVRRSTGPSDQTDLNPTLSLALQRPGHDFSVSYSHYQQDAHLTGGMDSLIRQTTLAYTHSAGEHRFGLEANHFSRDPSSGLATSAYRVATTWTWSFDRPVRVRSADQPAAPLAGAALRLTDFLPTMPMAAIRQRLKTMGQGEGQSSPGRQVQELTLLQNLPLRQRLALFHDGDQLQKAVLVLDFPAGAGAADMARDYQRVVDALYKQLGSAESRMEEGVFSANLPIDLTLGRFKRWLEWRTPTGMIRMGIPARPMGPPRMEILYATTLPNSLSWSADVPD